MSQPTPTGQANLTWTGTEGVTTDILDSESEGNPPAVSDKDKRVLYALQFSTQTDTLTWLVLVTVEPGQ